MLATPHQNQLLSSPSCVQGRVVCLGHVNAYYAYVDFWFVTFNFPLETKTYHAVSLEYSCEGNDRK